MDNVLYEAQSSYGINETFIVLGIICAILILVPAMELKDLKFKESKFGYCFLIFIIVFAVFVFACSVYTLIDGRDEVYDEYKDGNYCTVEGEITNYYSEYDLSNEVKYDSFEVSGLVFHTPGFTTQWGYPLTQSDGSPLKNGIKVKIRYIHYKFENVIMYLELIE